MFGNSPVKAAGKAAAIATQNLVHRVEQERRMYQELIQNLHRAAQILDDAAHMLPQIRPQIRMEAQLPVMPVYLGASRLALALETTMKAIGHDADVLEGMLRGLQGNREYVRRGGVGRDTFDAALGE